MSRPTGKKWLAYLKSHWLLYAMLIPGIVYIIFFKYIPMYGVTIAFRNYNGIGDISSAPWVGWANFARLFSTRAFKRALTNNIVISVEKLIFGFPSPIILALIIDSIRRKRIKKVVQTAVILPNLISWVVLYGVLYAILSPSTGVVKALLEAFGYQGTIPNLLAQKSSFRALIVISHIWQASGTATVVYLAAIMGVDQELYDAAAIDGAGYWRQLWHVTLSGIRTTVATLFVIRVGDLMFAGFDQIFAISNDAVITVCDIIDTYVYRIGLTQRSFSLATAAGLFQSATGLVLVLITNRIAKKMDPDSGLF
ncbi:MAG: sugar ABC transporter permease [Clostridia bacterium]|nr:sugar ABC transporter permease [Clostridia bacterium]